MACSVGLYRYDSCCESIGSQESGIDVGKKKLIKHRNISSVGCDSADEVIMSKICRILSREVNCKTRPLSSKLKGHAVSAKAFTKTHVAKAISVQSNIEKGYEADSESDV